jgi:hypothetical protein
MKWVKVNSSTLAETFELWNGDSKLAGASFNNASSIVRMASNTGKRLFFYGNKGWLTPKAVIKNEYGITLGKIETANETGEKGYVELDGKRYSYELNNDDSTKLDLFDDEMKNSIASCNFSNVITKGYSKTTSLMSTRFPQLLLLLCWYSFNMQHTASQQPAPM